MIGIGNILSSPPVSQGVVYDAESNALFTRMTTAPSDARKAIIDAFIVGIKSDLSISNLSDAFDALWFMASHDQQAARLNWVEDDHNLTEVNTPTWTADQGYTGDGVTKYIATDFIPSTDGVNFLLNNNSFGAYCRLDLNATEAAIGTGVSLPSRSYTHILPRFSGNLFYRNCQNDLTSSASAIADSLGLSACVRTASNAVGSYRNGSSAHTDVDPSTILSTIEFYLLGDNQLDVVSTLQFPSSNQIGFAFIGSGTIDQSALYTRVQACFTSLGTQV